MFECQFFISQFLVKFMKNAKVKGKDGKPQKKLRVAKFNFCTMGIPFPFRNNMSIYDIRPAVNNMISFNKNSNNEFPTCSYPQVNRNLPSASTTHQPPSISVITGPQISSRSTSYLPMQYNNSNVLKERLSEMSPLEARSLIRHHYFNNLNPHKNSNESCNPSQSNKELPSINSNIPNPVLSDVPEKEEIISNDSKNNIHDSSLKFPQTNFLDHNSFHDIIPSSFDIVGRGPLPSIILKTNGNIEFLDL